MPAMAGLLAERRTRLPDGAGRRVRSALAQAAPVARRAAVAEAFLAALVLALDFALTFALAVALAVAIVLVAAPAEAIGRVGQERVVAFKQAADPPSPRAAARARSRERAQRAPAPTAPKRAKGEPLAPPPPHAEADRAEPLLADPPLAGLSAPPSVVRNPDALPNPNLAPRPAPLAGLRPDHTVASVASVAELERLCRVDGGPLACKMTVTGLGRPDGALNLYDPRFYAYHDEWMWMHQLAGHSLADGPLALPGGHGYATVAEAYRAVAAMAAPPPGLMWTSGRLYADGYYELAARPGSRGRPRAWMAATLRWLPAEPRRHRPGALWLVEFEETDAPTPDELARLLAVLRGALPADVASALHWLVRPTAPQEAVVVQLPASHPLAGKTVRYDELIVPGRAAGYTQGVAAGWLRLVRRGEDAMGIAGPNDIVLLEQLPDALPPVAGIVTLHEQAAQAHVNLLAAARGTPNAAAPDLVTDPTTRALATRDAPVALLVTADRVQLKALLPDQLARWQRRSGSLPPQLMPYDPRGDAYLLDLRPDASTRLDAKGETVVAASAATVAPSTGLVGGKAAGMWRLLRSVAGGPVATPPAPLVLTTRCYVETVAPLEGLIFDVLSEPLVQHDRRARMLALQGPKGFEGWHQPGTQAHREGVRWLAALHQLQLSPAFRTVLQAGGIQAMVRKQPLSSGCASTALPAIAAHVAELAPGQGLRFRSSSSVEDLPGFNGAGLYRSVTGWATPEAGSPSTARARRSMAAAISEVFASYWSFEAYEEREAAAIWHLDGAMAVLVHPRFDDDKERANGVVLARVRDQVGVPTEVVVEINAQAGATSVTNARGEAGGRPYIARLRRSGDGAFALEVRSPADVPRPSALDDPTLRGLAAGAEAAARAQLAAERRQASPHQQPLSTVADLEFRLVAPGWPARRDGAVLPGRLVLKQLRPLSRPARIDVDQLDMALRGNEAVPTDVLPYAERVVRRSCLGGGLQVTALLVDLDPGAPMRASDEQRLLVAVQVHGRVQRLRLRHSAHVQSSALRRDGDGLHIPLDGAGADGATALHLADDGTFTLASAGATLARGRLRCRERALAETETIWLRSLFAPTTTRR